MNRQTTSMTDPLTPEGREVVESIRALLNAGVKTNLMEMKMAVRIALSIIDSLSAPKQYTEAELREGFASQYQDGLHVGENGKFTDRQIEANFAKWVECARFLGALKEPHA